MNKQIEQLSKMIFLLPFLPFVMIPKCIVSFSVYFFTDRGSDAFELQLLMWWICHSLIWSKEIAFSIFSFAFEKRFPFSTNNLIGNSIAALLQFIIIEYQYIILACTLSLGMGAFCCAISVTNEIRRILHIFHAKTQANEIQSNELELLLSEFINAHTVVKQLSESFSF